jgi:DNA-directed RNA polymerase sigma subunit (sigma70/sigma32)
MVDASYELRRAYYYGGYKEDSMLPELPCPPMEEEEYIDPVEEVAKRQLAVVVQDVLEGLTPRETKILYVRFGIGLTQDYTLDEVGSMFDVTKERIRQIEAKALRKLSHPSRSELLRECIGNYQTTAQKEAERLAEWARIDKERLQQRAKSEVRIANLQARDLTKKKLKEAKDNWNEIEPMLADAPWITQLEKAHPEMHQELKYMVGDIWGDHAKQVWDMYQQLRGQT